MSQINELTDNVVLCRAKLSNSIDLKMHVINLEHLVVNPSMQLADTPKIFGMQIICQGKCNADTVDALLVVLKNVKLLRFIEIVGHVPSRVLDAIRMQEHVTRIRFSKCTKELTGLRLPKRTAILSFFNCMITELPTLDISDLDHLREFYVLNTNVTSLSNLTRMGCLERMVLRNNKLRTIPPWMGTPSDVPARYEIHDEKELTSIPIGLFFENSPTDLVITGCPNCQFPASKSGKSNITSVFLSDFAGDRFPDVIGLLPLVSLTLINCPVLCETAVPTFTETLSTLRIAGCNRFDPMNLTNQILRLDNVFIVQTNPRKIMTSLQEIGSMFK